MSGLPLVQCVVCGFAFYPTKKGALPKHMPDGRKNDGGVVPPQPAPPARQVTLLQRKKGKLGGGLGKTTGWIHRAALQADPLHTRAPWADHGKMVIVKLLLHPVLVLLVGSAGVLLGTALFGADRGGYQALIGWSAQFGTALRFGIEGTGSYGRGLASAVRRGGHDVVEVARPNRADRHRRAAPRHSSGRRSARR